MIITEDEDRQPHGSNTRSIAGRDRSGLSADSGWLERATNAGVPTGGRWFAVLTAGWFFVVTTTTPLVTVIIFSKILLSKILESCVGANHAAFCTEGVGVWAKTVSTKANQRTGSATRPAKEPQRFPRPSLTRPDRPSTLGQLARRTYNLACLSMQKVHPLSSTFMCNRAVIHETPHESF
jgi:hypothetical protein